MPVDNIYTTIHDISGGGTIVFGENVEVTDIAFEESGEDLLLHYGDQDVVKIEDALGQGGGTSSSVISVNRYEFSNGNVFSYEGLLTEIEAVNTNTPPVARDDTHTGSEDQYIYISAAELLDNDSDPEGRELTITHVGNAINGHVSYYVGSGNITFSPYSDYSGPASFDYQVSDGLGGIANATVNLNIAPVNDAPFIANSPSWEHSFITDQFNSVSINTNGTIFVDEDGDQLTLSATMQNGEPLPDWLAFDAQSQILSGTPEVGADDRLIISVTATDPGGESVSRDIFLTIGEPGYDWGEYLLDFEQLQVGTHTNIEDHGVIIQDASGGQINIIDDSSIGQSLSVSPGQTISVTGAQSLDLQNFLLSTGPGSGSIEIVGYHGAGWQSITQSYTGAQQIPIDLTASGWSNLDSIEITVSGDNPVLFDDILIGTHADVPSTNLLPLAVDDNITIVQDEISRIYADDLTNNDIDGDDTLLEIVDVYNIEHGTIDGSVTDSFTFLPEPGYSGTAQLDYLVQDSAGNVSSARVTIDITPATTTNTAPTAADDTLNGTQGQVITITAAELLANDSDADGDTLSISAVSNALNGTVVLETNGDITFTPDAGYSGAASFDYTISDGQATSTATVSLDITTDGITLTGTAADDTLYGTNGADTLDGVAGNDDLFGGDGNDSLIGGTGNDYLNGQGGNDQMDGGAGNDKYVVDSSSDVVTEQANAGTDLVYSTADYALSDHVEELILQGSADLNGTGNAQANKLHGNSGANTLDGAAGNDHLYGREGDDILIGGDGDDTLIGGAGNDSLIGGAGDDFLNGQGGIDTFEGGAGNDDYEVDDASDSIIEQADAGLERVYSTTSYILSDHVEQLILQGSADLNGTGSAQDNSLFGNSGANILDGGDGNDRIFSHDGDDTLIGGNGDDVLNGGNGSDMLYGGVGDDWLNGQGGVDTLEGGIGSDDYVVDNIGDTVIEQADAGADRIFTSIDYSISDNVEQLILQGTANLNGIGNILANSMHGNSGDNTLSGGEGNDRLYGRDGDDTLIGETGNDTLTGGTGTDILIGGEGDDTLIGQAGNDTHEGGNGDDSYQVDSSGDIIIEQADAGTERVYSTANYQLSDHVEQLILQGTADLNGNGSAQDNSLFGNTGANILNGGAGNDRLFSHNGNDTLIGGTGNDFLRGQAGDDSYLISRGEGADAILELANEGNDNLQFLTDIDHDQLWFSQQGNHLKIQVIGTQDQVTINDWYAASGPQVETITASDGLSLAANQVQQLVNAMAGFEPPPNGELTLPDDLRDQLAPTLAAGWA